MSFAAAAAAMDYAGDLTAHELLVLIVIGNYANQNSNACFPAQKTLAEKTRLSERTVRSVMAALEDKGLITRTPRRSATTGAPISDMITVNLEIEVRVKTQRQDVPVGSRAAQEAPQQTQRQIASDLPANGAGKPITEPEVLPPTPKGDVEAVWEITPTKSRQRSTSKAQVERSLGAAYKRGHTLEQILGGLKGYFASREATRENGQYIKGVHRMIENDRWLEFSAKAPVHHMAPASPWPRRLHEWVTRSEWDDAGWGPRPGQPGCKAPADEAAQALAERAAAREARLAKQAGASS
jgi:Helix-turn-helix domain